MIASRVVVVALIALATRTTTDAAASGTCDDDATSNMTTTTDMMMPALDPDRVRLIQEYGGTIRPLHPIGAEIFMVLT